MSMTLFSQSMLTAVQGIPPPGTFVSGDGGNFGSVMKYKSLVPSSLEDLGLVMEVDEGNPVGWGVNSGGVPLPSNARQPGLTRKGHRMPHGMQAAAMMGHTIFRNVVDPEGQVVGTVKPMVLQPMSNGPRAGVIQGIGHQYTPLSRHAVPQDGSVIARQPVVLDHVWQKNRYEFVANTAGNPNYVLVPENGTLGGDLNQMGKVVRSERTMDRDPKQAHYVMNQIVLGPPVGVPPVTSMNPNGNAGYPGLHSGCVEGPMGALPPYGYVPPWLQGVQYGSAFSYGQQMSGASVGNYQAAPAMVPQFNPVMQSPRSQKDSEGSSLLESALMGMKITMKSAFEQYNRKKAEERRKAKKESATKRKRGTKGVLSDLQPTSAPKRQRQRKKKAEAKGDKKKGGKEKGGDKEKATTPFKEKAKKTYSRKRGGGLVVEGESEEIIVEVDVPMMLMDDDEEDDVSGGDPVARDAEEDDEVVELDRSDPLAPSSDEFAAVEKMRRKNGSGNGMQFTLLNWKKHLVMLPKQVKVLNGKTSAESGHKMSSKGSLPVALKECYVRLERCDAPRTSSNNNARKAETSSGNSKEMKITKSKGPEDVETIPSAEESSPAVSPSKTPRSQRQEADYWLKMLDQERKEALEALEVVRKRLDEEQLACSAALMSVRSSVLEKEFQSEDTSLDERRWTLLEEEFKRRDELKRKSVSESSEVSVVEASPIKSPEERVKESTTVDAKSAKGGECQRVRRPNGSRKMLGWRKEDSPVPSSLEGSTKADDASNKLLHEDESCTSLALSDERLAMPERAIRDPRIAKLQDKYLAEKSSKCDGWPRTKECYVKLERLDNRSVVKCASGSGTGTYSGAGESVANGISRMVVDSVEMQTLTVSTNSVEESDKVLQAWHVCLQGRVGLKESRQTDPIADGKSLPKPGYKRPTSRRASKSSEARFLTVELNKVVVMTEKLEKSTCVPEQESERLPALKGSQTIRVPGLKTDQRRSRRGSCSQSGRPQLKECFVLLRRCDEVAIPTSNGCPPRKRRKRM